jgi:arylformamidase
MAWIDITVPLDDNLPVWPGDPAPERGLVSSMADGAVCNVTRLSLCAHNGTHVDAPFHFIADGRTIETITPDLLCGRCRVVDCGDADWITRDVVTGFGLAPSSRVLFRTRNSRLWGSPEFAKDAVGFDPGGAKAVVQAGVSLVGIDYLSVGNFHKHGIKVHHTLLGAGIPLIEGLNLREAPAGEYELFCAPLLLPGADGAPARVFLRTLS